MSFIERIQLDDHGISFHDLLFQQRRFPWPDIKQVRSDISSTHGEGISFQVYDIISRHHRLPWTIGPWIARYKDLLRDILTHLPDDAQTDVHVYHAIRRRGETVEDAYRALGRHRAAPQEEKAPNHPSS
jgi:hypothetical protein